MASPSEEGLSEDVRGDYAIGDLVWGRFSGNRWWPAVVYDPEKVEKPVKVAGSRGSLDPEKAVSAAKKGNKPGRHFISFFGDNTVSWIDKADLLPFEEKLVEFAKQGYTPLFRKAVEEALEHIEEVGAAVAYAQVKGIQPVRTLKEGVVPIVADIAAIVGSMLALGSEASLLYLKALAIGQEEAPADRAAGARARGLLLAHRDSKLEHHVTSEEIEEEGGEVVAAPVGRRASRGAATPGKRGGSRVEKKGEVGQSKRRVTKAANVGKKEMRAVKARGRSLENGKGRAKKQKMSSTVSTPPASEGVVAFKRRGRLAQMQMKDGNVVHEIEKATTGGEGRKRQGRKEVEVDEGTGKRGRKRKLEVEEEGVVVESESARKRKKVTAVEAEEEAADAPAVEETGEEKGKKGAKGRGRQKKGEVKATKKEAGIKEKRFTRWNQALAKSPEVEAVEDMADPFEWKDDVNEKRATRGSSRKR